MSITINSGKIDPTLMLNDVPETQEAYIELIKLRKGYLKLELSYDCRNLLRFVEEANSMYEICGYTSVNELVSDGLGLVPDDVTKAVSWLRKWKPDNAVSYDEVLELGEHGTNRYSSRGYNITSKMDRGTTATYTLARLKRDHPNLLQEVIEGNISPNAAAIQAGFRRPTTIVRTDSAESAAATLKRKCSDEFIFQLKQLL